MGIREIQALTSHSLCPQGDCGEGGKDGVSSIINQVEIHSLKLGARAKYQSHGHIEFCQTFTLEILSPRDLEMCFK